MLMDRLLKAKLAGGLDKLGLSQYGPQIEQYIKLLKKWNRAYNLVSGANDHTLLTRHIFDSLSVYPMMNKDDYLDVGTGAGLPGLLLAIVSPDSRWTLLDANGKKTRFCEQAVFELGLGNVVVVQKRIEQYHPDNCYDGIISRAYNQAEVFVKQTQRLLCLGGKILAMKGRIDLQERRDAQSTGLDLEIIPLPVLHSRAQRHLMVFS